MEVLQLRVHLLTYMTVLQFANFFNFGVRSSL